MDGRTNISIGGASLNYSVVGGTTQPTSPKENAIWVNTDTAITSHVFSTTQPSSPVAGMVWFNIGTSATAPINILKKDNTVMVYPDSCYQYISGAWVSKTAKTYQNGAWVEWKNFIFNNGALGISGGFTSNDAAKFSVGDTLHYSLAQYTHIGAYSVNKINLTNFKTMVVDGVAGRTMSVGFNKEQNNEYSTNNQAAKVDLPSARGTKTLDISALTGEYYFSTYYTFDGSGSTSTADIYSVELLK